MKKLLAALVLLPGLAFAQGKTGNFPAVMTLDPQTLTTATAFTSNLVDTSAFTAMTCELTVTAGDSRALIPTCYAEKTATTATYAYPTMTVAGAAKGRYVFDPRQSAATADTGVTDSPHALCRWIKFTAASGGPGTLSCTLRN